jgi:hypothetical protein
MGRVLDGWAPHLSDRAFRVLMVMAFTALDSPSREGRPAGVYFGGRGDLARALRKGEDPLQSVKKAVRELVKAGVIERAGSAYTGTRMTYRLVGLLDQQGEERGSVGDPQSGKRGAVGDPQEGVRSGPERWSVGDPPRNQEKPGVGTTTVVPAGERVTDSRGRRST